MNLKRIESLLKLMVTYDVTELEQTEEGSTVRLVRGGGVAAVPVVQAAPIAAPVAAAAAPAAPAAEEEGEALNSPMVGTFYRSAKPGSPPFVNVGDRVHKGQTLCIIEAMKLMNELESEVDGVVAAILVENEQPVQFGQPLFRIVSD